MIDTIHLEEDKRLKWSYFLNEDGLLNPEVIERFGGGFTAEELATSRSMAASVLAVAIKSTLPHFIPYNVSDFSISEISDWMRANAHDGWQVSMRNRESCIAFARWADALHFKLAFT